MIESGIIVGLGLLVMLWKMNWVWRIRILSSPLTIDLVVFIAFTAIHWGTFSGVMVAAVASLFCSLTLSLGRWAIGYVEKGKYVPGKLRNVGQELRSAP